MYGSSEGRDRIYVIYYPYWRVVKTQDCVGKGLKVWTLFGRWQSPFISLVQALVAGSHWLLIGLINNNTYLVWSSKKCSWEGIINHWRYQSLWLPLKVKLCGCYKMTEAGLYYLVNKCSKLKTVHMKGTSVTILPQALSSRNIEIDYEGYPCISPEVDILRKSGISLMQGK